MKRRTYKTALHAKGFKPFRAAPMNPKTPGQLELTSTQTIRYGAAGTPLTIIRRI